MKAFDLPKEILQHIFYYLEERFPYFIFEDEEDLVKGSLLQLQLTCKHWSQVAREVFYRKVDLAGGSEKAALFLRTLRSSSDIGQAVEGLSFSDETFTTVSFASIIKSCPNLKMLLQWEESDFDFYTPSLALYRQGFLQKLEKVSPPPNMFYIDAMERLYQKYNKLTLAARKTITSLQLSQASQFELADQLKEFINLKEIGFAPNSSIGLQQLSRLLAQGNHAHLKAIDINSIVPTTDQHQRDQSLLDGLTQNSCVKKVEMELRPLSLQNIQRIQYMFPQVHNLVLNRRSASLGAAISPLIIPEENPDPVFDQFFKYVSATKDFYAGSVALSFKELVAALTMVSKHFQVCHVSIELVNAQDTDQHNFLIASAEHFERIVLGNGEKPDCGIGLEINCSQVDDAFCRGLYKTLARKTAPLDMAIIGRLAPQNQYLGNHIGYLLVHCPSLLQLSMYDLSITIPPLPDTDHPCSVLNISVSNCTITPGTLQEVAKKLILLNMVKIDNVKVSDTTTQSDIMEISMPEACIKSLILYDRRPDYRKNVIFKVQLTSGTFYYYIDSNGWVTKLPHSVYLSRQNSMQTKVPEFVIICHKLYRIFTAGGTIDIV